MSEENSDFKYLPHEIEWDIIEKYGQKAFDSDSSEYHRYLLWKRGEREPVAWMVENSVHMEIIEPVDLKFYDPKDGWTNTPLYK